MGKWQAPLTVEEEKEEEQQLQAALAASLASLSLEGAVASSSAAAPATPSAPPPAAASCAGPEPEAEPTGEDDTAPLILDEQGVCHGRSLSSHPACAAPAAPKEQPSAASRGGPPCPERDPTLPDSGGPPSQRGAWCYVVWRVDGQPDLRGIHRGGRQAWRFLEGRLGGYAYSRGHRLRRAEHFQDAQGLYVRGGLQHGSPMPAAIFWH